MLTIGTGLGMIFTNAFFSGYDIASVHTATDVLDGTISVFMYSMFAAVGVYAHRLAYR